MKLKISIIFLLFAMFLTLSACSQSNNNPSNEKITNSPVITESKNKESDVRTFALSDYTYEVEFIDENEILKIKESYDIDNTDSISKIVYVPFIDELNTKETTSKYTIKELESEEKNVDLIYSSQFEAPSGVARIERTMSAKNVFYEKCDNKELENALQNTYNFDMSKDYKINKEYEIKVDEGSTKQIKAYEIDRECFYEILKDDNSLGMGKLDKPMGTLIVFE